MRIFISVDMEGATGVVHRDQLTPEGRTYSDARKLLTGDVNAAIEGALREAPDAVFRVADGHGVMRNIVLEELHDRAELVMGPATWENRPQCQVQGADDSFELASCAVAASIGGSIPVVGRQGAIGRHHGRGRTRLVG